jgi:hypothetical protein
VAQQTQIEEQAMAPETLAAILTNSQIEMMINHIDGYCPVVLNRDESPTRVALIKRRLLCYPGWACSGSRPVVTALTELGKEVICIVLGWRADQLYRRQLIQESSMQIVDELTRRLKLEKRPGITEVTT